MGGEDVGGEDVGEDGGVDSVGGGGEVGGDECEVGGVVGGGGGGRTQMANGADGEVFMTRGYRVAKKAEDVLMGDKIFGWSLRDGVKEKALRVLDRKKKGDQIMLVTTDWSILVYPEMLITVEEIA